MRVGTAPRGDIDPSRWAVDQRPFVWPATSKPGEAKAPGSFLRTTWTDVPHHLTPLPYAPCSSGLTTTSDNLESSNTLEWSTPAPGEGKELPSKVWGPELNGGQAAMGSVFRYPRSFPVSSADRLQSIPRITFMPVLQELTDVGNPTDAWDSSTSKGEGFQRSSTRVEDLTEEDRVQNSATLICKLSGSSTYTGKSSAITHHKASHSSRPRVPKKAERASPSQDISVFESLSDNDGLSYEEGVQTLSEKRRKRMLSNRASAQRSRQRRQERLDTLEVLVAELRVENAALTRRANHSALAAKKFEQDNKILRDRLGKRGPLPSSDPSNERDKITEDPEISVNNNKNGGASRRYEVSIDPARNGSSSANTGETRYHESHSRESSLPSKTIRDDETDVDNSKPWRNNVSSSSSFDLELNSDPMEGAAADFCGGGETLNRTTGVPEGVNVRDLYQSALMTLAQPHSFQNLDAYGIEFDQCSQEMDKKNLYSRSVEDIWLDSLANCLK